MRVAKVIARKIESSMTAAGSSEILSTKSSNMQNDGVLKVSENQFIPKRLMASKIHRYRFHKH